ncbi:Protein of unknown function [Gryllus bimaculatus]|nr:Protein of unknown function [Gryllus bimaculatus]
MQSVTTHRALFPLSVFETITEATQKIDKYLICLQMFFLSMCYCLKACDETDFFGKPDDTLSEAATVIVIWRILFEFVGPLPGKYARIWNVSDLGGNPFL